ncbi:hypothetical protein D3C81_1858780 [compost metagenome]
MSAEQPARAQPRHVIDCNVQVPGVQCQVDGFVGKAQGAEQTAGGQAQAVDVDRGSPALQHLRHCRQQAMPFAVTVERLEERLRLQQLAEQLPAVQVVPQLGAEIRREAW